MERKVIIIRGLPGSSKSTLAKYIEANYLAGCAIICEADQYFTDRDGNYNFDVKYLARAHEYCQNKFKNALIDKIPCIIVSNTNTQHKEYKYYKDEALTVGYFVQVITVGEFTDEAVDAYALSNIHGVPRDKIKQMRDRFQL